MVELMETGDQTSEESGQEKKLDNKDNKHLDLFWKLGRSKVEKERIDAASKILKFVGNSSLDINYSLSRLVKGLASNSSHSREGYFVCLTEFLRQTTCNFGHVSKVVESDLKTNSDLAKGEEADYLVARLLVVSSILRAGLALSESERESVIDELLDLGSSRSYLTHPSVLLLAEHFTGSKWGERILVKLGVSGKLNLSEIKIDHLYLLLNFRESDSSCITDQILGFLGEKKILGKKAIEGYATAILNSNLPPSILISHPVLTSVVKSIYDAGSLSKFWTYISAEMSISNNKGIIGWMVLREMAKVDVKTAASVLGKMGSKGVLDVCKAIASKGIGIDLVKDFWRILMEAAVKGEIERLVVLKNLLEADICWDKSGAGSIVHDLLASATPEEVEAVSEIYLKLFLVNDKLEERVHCGGQLVKLSGLPQMKQKLEWRAELFKRLAEVSLLNDIENLTPLSSNAREQIREILFRALEKRFSSLEDSVVVLGNLVGHIRTLLSSGKASRMKELDDLQSKEIETADEIIEALEKMKLNASGKDGAVFLYLYYHMWLQSLSNPALCQEVFSELHPVYRRWGSKEVSQDEPQWIEVASEIFLSLLAQNSNLLRGVVGCAFSGVCDHLTQTALDSLLAVLKDRNVDDDDESDEESEMDEEDVEMDETVAASEDESEDDESDEESDESDEEKEDLDEDLTKKISSALGEHADKSGDEESDLDMDLIPDEDMAKLDQKLVDAFKQLGGRKDEAAKKKERMSSLAKVHFKLRVLDIIEIYLNHQPKVEFISIIVSSLLEALEASVRDQSQAQLTKKLIHTISKVASLTLKEVSSEVASVALEVLDQLFNLGNSGSVLMTTLGQILPKLCSFLIRFGELSSMTKEFENRYVEALDQYLLSPQCVLSEEVFSLAMGRSWTGCWSLAKKLAEYSSSSSVRMFRKVSALALLIKFFKRRALLENKDEEMRQLSSVLMPNLLNLLESMKDGVTNQSKPKYVENIFTLLWLMKSYSLGDEGSWTGVGEIISLIVKKWPNGQHFKHAKRSVNNLASKMNLEVDFNLVKKLTTEVNGEHIKKGKKKNKNKKKSQEALKEAKARKVKLAEAESTVGVPSFTEHVSDTINDASVLEESNKRKSPDHEESISKVKKKKSKKS